MHCHKYIRLAIVFHGITAAAQSPNAPGDWTAYGHDQHGSRFSPLTQISRDNVAELVLAWTYRTGDAAVDTRNSVKFEATPLMIDGTLYLSTPLGRVIALDPERGAERWRYDAHVDP